MPDRCHTCDRPLATQADQDAHQDGCECERCCSLCWSAWGGCEAEPVDWRARALKAEAELAAHLEWGRPQILYEQLKACRAFKDDLERRWRAAQDRLTEAGL